MLVCALFCSGNYETCTPTLSFIRAKLSKETDYLTDIHRDTKENCRYCGDQVMLGLESYSVGTKLQHANNSTENHLCKGNLENVMFQ